MNAELIAQTLIKQHEGLVLEPYRCTAGKLTIGYGTNLEDRGISQQEAEYLLQNDLDRIQVELLGALPWLPNLDEFRLAALYDMAYNLGVNGLLGFRRMLAALEAKDYPRAATEAKASQWFTQVGRRSERICYVIEFGRLPEN